MNASRSAPTFLSPCWDVAPRVVALTRTRVRGCSEGTYAGCNLATHVGDEAVAVESHLLGQVAVRDGIVHPAHQPRQVRYADLGVLAVLAFDIRLSRHALYANANHLHKTDRDGRTGSPRRR